MRGGKFLSCFRQLGRQPVRSTPLIRNAFELGLCVSKPIKQGCMSAPSKQKEYFLIGLSSSLRQQAVAAASRTSTRVLPVSNSELSMSSAAAQAVHKEEACETEEPVAHRAPDQGVSHVSSSGYWSFVRNSGVETRPKSFSASELHESDLTKQRTPENFSDQLARLTVMALRFPTDFFFRKRYFCRAAMLETIAGVPGMVASMILHCKSLRKIEHSGGWIKALMEEAENERMHLMTFMELSKPSWKERALIFAAQGVFLNAYSLIYMVSPRFAHRMIGYLWEETVQSYSQLIKDIDEGRVSNCPAPEIAIDYWSLAPNATLRDVILVIRADEVYHREVNHYAADSHMHGQVLKQGAVPVSSH